MAEDPETPNTISRAECADMIERGMFRTYLGDGLYADWDGFHFKLAAERDGITHWVGLEPTVLAAFEQFTAEVKAFIERIET